MQVAGITPENDVVVADDEHTVERPIWRGIGPKPASAASWMRAGRAQDRTVSVMSETRAQLIHELERLANLVPLEASNEFWEAFGSVVARVVNAFSPPDVVRVGHEHLGVAMSITTAYLDESAGHSLLATLLASVEDQMAMDPSFRLGVVGALGQLVVDGLTAAVVTAAVRDDGDGLLDDEDEVDQEAVRSACSQILQRIALARRAS